MCISKTFKERMFRMKLSLKDIEMMAQWSKLELDQEEKLGFEDKLNKILQKIDIIKELDTNHVQLTEDRSIHRYILRDDKVGPSLNRDLVLKNAQDTRNGMFSVPSILD